MIHKFITLIPAKKDSSNLKDKNILKIKNKFLFEYPLNVALNTSLLKNSIGISTNSDLILRKSKKLKIKYVVKRSNYLSRKSSKISDAIKHFLNFINFKKKGYNTLVLLEPTSPLTTAKHLNLALKKYIKQYPKSKALVSLGLNDKINTDNLFSINKGNLININKSNNFQNDVIRQKHKKTYYLDGSFYISDINYFLENKGFLGKLTSGYVLDKKYNFEIDDKFDFNLIKNYLIDL
jgi:CMP-N,N'-diacetyllegionaminic acid synthase